MSRNDLFSECPWFYAVIRWLGALSVSLFAVGSVLQSLAEPSPLRWLSAASVVGLAAIAIHWAVKRRPLSVPRLRLTVVLTGLYAAGEIVGALRTPSLSHTLMAVAMSILALAPLPLLWHRSTRWPES